MARSAFLEWEIGRGIALAALMAVALMATAARGGPAPTIGGEARVLDRQSMLIGERRHVRLKGFYNPVIGQTCLDADGAEVDVDAQAAALLAELVDGRQVLCRVSRSHGGAAIAACSVAGRDLGEQLISSGWVAPESSVGDYAALGRSAQTARRGMWGLSCRSRPA